MKVLFQLLLIAIISAVSIESKTEQTKPSKHHVSMMEALPKFNLFVSTTAGDVAAHYGLAQKPESNTVEGKKVYSRIRERGMSFGEMSNAQLYGIVFGYTVLTCVVLCCVFLCVMACCCKKDKKEDE